MWVCSTTSNLSNLDEQSLRFIQSRSIERNQNSSVLLAPSSRKSGRTGRVRVSDGWVTQLPQPNYRIKRDGCGDMDDDAACDQWRHRTRPRRAVIRLQQQIRLIVLLLLLLLLLLLSSRHWLRIVVVSARSCRRRSMYGASVKYVSFSQYSLELLDGKIDSQTSTRKSMQKCGLMTLSCRKIYEIYQPKIKSNA